ncbi:MAG: prepilin-type N-terminal cleavage/methylation domain-containing protein [Pyrinomonadaceae bacterium]
MIFKSKKKLNRVKTAESGFSLIETVIAMVIFLISVLGIFAAFTFAVSYNSGNSKRSQCLSVLQREVELMRSAKFTPTFMDTSLTGGVKAAKTVVSSDGFTYLVNVTVDDDPLTADVQINSAQTLKEITIVVTAQAANGSWETAFQTKSVLRRVRAN